MRQIGLLLLLVGLVSALELPRGVGPEFARHFSAKDSFSCISNPSITLSPSQINDDFCDCPDGSDEPGTAACAHLGALSPPQPLPGSPTGTTNTTNALPGFWCANHGHVGAYVPFSFVNDGVCDHSLCCDGSDEWAGVGGTRCADRCAEIGQEWRRAQDERRMARERAIKKRNSLAKESRQLRRQAEAKVVALRTEIATLETRVAELQNKYQDVRRQERGKVVRAEGQGGKLGVLLGLARKRVEELRGALDAVVQRRDALAERVNELERTLVALKEGYNPNFNDEGVKAAVRAWEDYAARQDTSESAPVEGLAEEDLQEMLKVDGEESGINWAEFEEQEATDTDILFAIEAYLPGPLRDYLHAKLNKLRIWLIEHGLLADNPRSGGESRLEAAAREAAETAEQDLTAKRASLEEGERDLERDYGADDIFRAVRGRCISVEEGEYVYELCWLDKTTQRAKRGGGHTSLGQFDRIDVELADEEEGDEAVTPGSGRGRGLGSGPRLVLRFESGQGCWNGPQRRTDVWLACSETEEVWKVSEAEKCVYRMEVGTPLACVDELRLDKSSVVGPEPQKDEL